MEKEEWNELVALRESLNENLMAYDSETQEKFVGLLVKSLEGKGDVPVGEVSRTA